MKKKLCKDCAVVIHPKYTRCRECYVEHMTPKEHRTPFEIHGEEAQRQIDDGYLSDALAEMDLEDEEFFSPNIGCK